MKARKKAPGEALRTCEACARLRISRQAFHKWAERLELEPHRVHNRLYLWAIKDVLRVTQARSSNQTGSKP